jgi:glycosyltransferase involved in cell wall biosynthesis
LLNCIDVGIVVIGRNEGPRLERCLVSIPRTYICVYVDSESQDDSLEIARRAGAVVISLSSPPKHSAARARNAGISWIREHKPTVNYVMLVDGDCEIEAGWMTSALEVMTTDPSIGLVFGRRRERFPGNSIYNALCDDEWNQPIGEAYSCGGDVLCRLDAVISNGGYRETMIAGEDPDFATRMRDNGWRILRIDAPMTIHDAAILRFSQWWQRTRRGGHAFGELAYLHPHLKQPNWRAQCRSIVVWGVILPFFILVFAACAAAQSVFWLLAMSLFLALWPAQVVRLTLKRGDLPFRLAFANAYFLMLGKVAQAIGLIEFHLKRWFRRETQLIEYKELR